MNISVIYNKPSVRFATSNEHREAEDDTEHSAREVAEALRHNGDAVTLVPLTESTLKQRIRELSADLVFNLIEWTGIDTPYAVETFDLLDARKIRYTGATKENYLDSCDKTVIKRKVAVQGLPTAGWQVFTTGNESVRSDLVYPMIVKVSLEHSSVGIAADSVVSTPEDLIRVVRQRIREYRQPVFAETFLPGREFQVTLLERADGLIVLPPAEIVYATGTNVPLLTYESRWDEAHADYSNSQVKLAALDHALEARLREISETAFRTLGFRDYARFDIRCDAEERPYFLELNCNPGLGDDPEYGMTVSYRAVGMSFSDFIREIVHAALRRYGMETDGVTG